MRRFSGKIESVEVTKKNRTWQVKVKCTGGSAALDRIPKKRSFQNTEMTYPDIVKEVTIGYTDITYVWNVDDSRVLGQPLIQYEETDCRGMRRFIWKSGQGKTGRLATGSYGMTGGIRFMKRWLHTGMGSF
ncbi:MAG: hypothetical protein K2N73_12645 [Lachnospiraceae bacterium]|nr:hypothetical protein [Lachnospiraceae bacterium]